MFTPDEQKAVANAINNRIRELTSMLARIDDYTAVAPSIRREWREQLEHLRSALDKVAPDGR